jgi:predicted dehydrogenase
MDKVKLAVIGIGNIGNLHLGNIEQQPKVQLTAVCDIVPEKADAAAAKYGVKAYYNSDALLADKVCDAIIIGTPHYFHTTIGIAALDSGHHVLVEKPISVHKADCERLIAAHERNPKQVFRGDVQPAHDPFLPENQRDGAVRRIGEVGAREHGSLRMVPHANTIMTPAAGGRTLGAARGGGVLLKISARTNSTCCKWITRDAAQDSRLLRHRQASQD